MMMIYYSFVHAFTHYVVNMCGWPTWTLKTQWDYKGGWIEQLPSLMLLYTGGLRNRTKDGEQINAGVLWV